MANQRVIMRNNNRENSPNTTKTFLTIGGLRHIIDILPLIRERRGNKNRDCWNVKKYEEEYMVQLWGRIVKLLSRF